MALLRENNFHFQAAISLRGLLFAQTGSGRIRVAVAGGESLGVWMEEMEECDFVEKERLVDGAQSVSSQGNDVSSSHGEKIQQPKDEKDAGL